MPTPTKPSWRDLRPRPALPLWPAARAAASATTPTARALACLPTGSVYDEAEMLDAQQRLANSGYYDAVFLTLDTESPDPQAAP